MRYWTELARFERDGFEIIVDKTWEDTAIGDLFDDTCYDIQELEQRVNDCDLDWFMLRARAMVNGHELGSSIVGGFLYEDARETLTDGTAEDLIYGAVREAQNEIPSLLERLQALVDDAKVS